MSTRKDYSKSPMLPTDPPRKAVVQYVEFFDKPMPCGQAEVTLSWGPDPEGFSHEGIYADTPYRYAGYSILNDIIYYTRYCAHADLSKRGKDVGAIDPQFGPINDHGFYVIRMLD